VRQQEHQGRANLGFLVHHRQDSVAAAPREGWVQDQNVGREVTQSLDARQSAVGGGHERAMFAEILAVGSQQKVITIGNQHADRP
jgi:hypothetical protein